MRREADARVRIHAALNNLNVLSVQPSDKRRLEIVASDLATYHGAQVAVNATLVLPLTRKNTERLQADWENEATLRDALKLKVIIYPELQSSRRCRLVTVAMKVRGKWDEDVYKFLLKLEEAKA